MFIILLNIYIYIYYLAGTITELSRESLDAMVPDTKEEFERFATVLSQKINQFNKHAEFPAFAEELIKSISLQCKHVF
jgi:ferritin-like protein